MVEWILDGGWIILVLVIGLVLSLWEGWLTRKDKQHTPDKCSEGFFGCEACEGSYDDETSTRKKRNKK